MSQCSHYILIMMVCSNSVLTTVLSTWTLGRAEAYSKNITFIPMPISIPSSKRMKRQERNVANAGIRSTSEKQWQLWLLHRLVKEHVCFVLNSMGNKHRIYCSFSSYVMQTTKLFTVWQVQKLISWKITITKFEHLSI
jgi:hypothetical protein